MEIVALDLPDLDAFVAHLSRYMPLSGVDGPHYTPHGRGHQPSEARVRESRREGWTTPVERTGWRRAWGVRASGQVLGHVELDGGALPSELHRATLSIGLEAPLRGRRLGERLMEAAIAWARHTPSLAWLDLGVFSHNQPARTLYARMGFVEVGRIGDRFRVDGVSIDDIQMVLDLR